FIQRKVSIFKSEENSMKTFKFIIFNVLLSILFFCSSQNENFTTETINGVKYIHNLGSKWGDKPKVRLEYTGRIGEEDSEDDNYIFTHPRLIGKDDSGNLYVFDSREMRMKIFDKNLKFVKQFGSKGEGPGEFAQYVFGMDIDAKGNSYIVEIRKRVQMLDKNGEHIESFLMGEMGNNFWIIRVLKNGNLATLSKFSSRIEPGKEYSLVKILDMSGNVLNSFGKPIEPSGEIWMSAVNDTKLDTDKDGNIYVVFLNQNRVDKYSSSGNLLFTADRPLNYEIDHKMVKPEGSRYKYPEMTNISQDIAVDGKGRIWVLTFKKQPEDKGSLSSTIKDHNIIDLEIFDKNGVLLGSIPTPKHVNNFRIFNDKIYFVDSYSTACVYEYQILEN
ncbi:6-bladed beta-propeller, partial [candidate division KSB1 bacterium]